MSTDPLAMAPATPPAPAPAAPDYNASIELPKRDTDTAPIIVSVDCSAIPAEARLAMLKSQAGAIIRNRVNVAEQRNTKARAPFVAWALFNAAQTADPLQTAVQKPEGDPPTGEAPALLDRTAKANEAIAALLKGEINVGREKSDTPARSRAPVDPLVKAITGVVTNAVFAAHQAAGTTVPVEGKAARKYTYPDAAKEVGRDGLAYLNAQIAAKVEAAPEAERAALQAQLEKSRDQRYVMPAKVMIGTQAPAGKGNAELPSIL